MSDIRHSAEIKSIAGALSKAQSSIQHAAKDKTNPHYRSNYATLASVLDACRDPLAKNGLSIIQMPSVVRDQGLSVIVTTRLAHDSGEWFESSLLIPVSAPGGAQQIGSAISYGRRYSLSAMVGVAQEDDDANQAQGAQNEAHKGNRGANQSAQTHNQINSQISGAASQKPPGKEDEKIEQSLANPGNYIVKCGKKYKGHCLAFIDAIDISDFMAWIKSKPVDKNGKPIDVSGPDYEEFLFMADLYLKQPKDQAPDLSWADEEFPVTPGGIGDEQRHI